MIRNSVDVASGECEAKLDSDWRVFRAALDTAISKVAEPYFRVSRFESDSVWRERAYCYEVYHQLRKELGDSFPYSLHAEIDKAGHAQLEQAFGPGKRPNPDFVLHKPGHPENLAIMEVKPSNAASKRIEADLQKIKKFLDQVGYTHGIMLLFGSAAPKRPSGYDGIEIIWHKAVGQTPVHILEGRTD